MNVAWGFGCILLPSSASCMYLPGLFMFYSEANLVCNGFACDEFFVEV